MDVTLKSAADQAQAVRNGNISARELLAATLDRYRRFNDDLNAVVFTRIDEAEARANAADEATARGESWGPLHGVPMTIKEPWDWVGFAVVFGNGRAGRLASYPELRSGRAASRRRGG